MLKFKWASVTDITIRKASFADLFDNYTSEVGDLILVKVLYWTFEGEDGPILFNLFHASASRMSCQFLASRTLVDHTLLVEFHAEHVMLVQVVII